jgi:hypothetical protein
MDDRSCTIQEFQSRQAAPGRRPIPWASIVASVVFSVATFEMLVLYGIVHWGIMFPLALESRTRPEAVFTVLSHLTWLRLLLSICAVIWAVWAVRASRRWLSWTALAFAILALMTNAVMM